MSLFGSSTNATSAGFSSGAPTYGGFGPPVGCGSFGVNVAPPPMNTSTSRCRLWMENASEPFGRVENTSKCFARNGERPTTSKWTPPKPPSHSPFQSVFHSNTVPLFGHSAEQKPKSLCGSSGGFAFGCGAPEPDAVVDASAGKSETMSLFGTCSKVGSGFGEPRTVFGSKSREAGGFTGGESRTAFGLNSLSASNKDPGRTVFGNASRCNEIGTGFGVGSTFAKPPLMPTSNPFAKSTQQLRTSSSNPFARTSVISSSNANPFEAQSSTFAVRVSANESVNPFAKPSGLPSNPFTEKKTPNVSVNRQNSSGSDKNLFAVPGSAWLTGQKSVGAAGSASLKFKSGLRPAFSIEASPWRTSTQQQQPVSSAPLLSFDWAVDSRKTASMHQSHETTSEASCIEAKNNSVRSSSSPANAAPEALVASPDSDPYGSGSFGAGLVEQKIKTAIDNPPSSVELKVLGGRSEPALIPRQQPSAKFASRLGLARQPLQVVPMRPVSRFPSHKRRTAPSTARSHLPQADPFCFSSSFSRLAISKKALRIKASGVPKPVVAVSGESDSSGEGSVADKEADAKVSPSPFCPVLRNKEYSTEPSMNELQQLSDDELSCVENFVISRRDCGKIAFVGATDVRGLQLDELVNFSDGEIVVYPDDNEKPAVGIGLNKPAIVDLCGISAEENESHENFLKRLELHTQKLGAIFLGYEDSKTGTSGVWKFRVEHF
ncbi:Nuclear pore complex protein NUP98A [Phytophthora citrophthora]|uniref:Nuclear pore complex protein NUP98A n=1 Tax=Phytophthora citrophthora TaxID=4793 RepID=A0AAD9FZ15_9STRA|nr:Nuclear pore complex protein NUP98A [Phytophthora citrophthora]